MSDPGAPIAGGTSPASVSAFLGRWRLARDILHADGLRGRLDGEARVAPAGPALCTYTEEGRLVLDAGEPLLATRRYLWRDAAGAIDISFSDGRPFHRVSLGAFCAETAHLCPPDRYAVFYDFSDWPVWTARWRVEGPRKDYEMTSTYTPLR